MFLLVKDSFELNTPLGKREIQLLAGDITKLQSNEKVDIVLTSAYYGDYAPIVTTLIGNLKDNLNISVHDLAEDKDVDLRSQFSCWVSKPLPSHLPYHRLVCFEYIRWSSSLVDQISNMFRAMMPIFNNKDTTVITPLLATGGQGHSSLKVLSGMFHAACEWIRAGLPLKCLKLVVYSANPSKPTSMVLECMKLFTKLKSKWQELENMDSIAELEGGPYDVCLSWAPENRDWVGKVCHQLLQENSKLKIYSDEFIFNHEDVWQKHIFHIMKNSKRIIVLLTPSYITNSECLEQFSIALCCNKLKKEETLVPFYLETIDSIPSYMILVQYIDCRVRKADQTQDVLLQQASSKVLKPSENSVSESLLFGSWTQDKDNDVMDGNRNITYDIFVSYSHSHGQQPKELVEILQRNHPEMSIFFDVSELKAGNLWQQVLYEAVGKAHCIVAFISPAYLTSSVCQEEFNIGLGRHFVQDSVLVVPVYDADVELIHPSQSSVPVVDIRNESLDILATKLVQLVKLRKNNKSIADIDMLKKEMECKRSLEFKDKFKLEGGHVVKNVSAQSGDMQGNVVFSYAPEMVCLAAIMSAIMKRHAPQLSFHLLASSQTQRRMHLDTADLVVVFISDQYLSSPYLVEELHTVLCRQRTVKDSTILYLIQCNHKLPEPVYLHLLPYNISLDDHFWRRLKGASSNKNPKYEIDIDGMAGIYRCTPDQNLGLTAAAHEAIFTLSIKGQGSTFPFSIENIYRLQKEAQKISDDMIPLKDHLVTLSSFCHDIVKKFGQTALFGMEQTSTNFTELTKSSDQPVDQTLEELENSKHGDDHDEQTCDEQTCDEQTCDKIGENTIQEADESTDHSIRPPISVAESDDVCIDDTTAVKKKSMTCSIL
ncbi:uncharacterized protein LOC106070936 isoform X2 [Biomphalaria glabrata]|nr:uncharacterized protein LOC106070936 isoform X2 [Biomphalaria glabrata]XP_055896771.1 uncharacterized protein LOC106070936 isoform X2 [Biomphalaria glabrata]XP_055896772.1 uncharacterized protein LOC106070936 isoform X2 [Biomphalaria glabrata]